MRARAQPPECYLKVINEICVVRAPTNSPQWASSPDSFYGVDHDDHQLLLRGSAQGWLVPDRGRLLDAWLAGYPGPAGLTSHWYALDPLAEQLARAVRAHRGRRIVVSGDLAADQIAPWRLPRTVQLYCAEPVDLREQGFVLSGADEATLALTAPQDPGVLVPAAGEDLEVDGRWAVMSTSSGPVELADPLQILADVASAGGPDAAEAAAVVRAFGTRAASGVRAASTAPEVRTRIAALVQAHVLKP